VLPADPRTRCHTKCSARSLLSTMLFMPLLHGLIMPFAHPFATPPEVSSARAQAACCALTVGDAHRSTSSCASCASCSSVRLRAAPRCAFIAAALGLTCAARSARHAPSSGLHAPGAQPVVRARPHHHAESACGGEGAWRSFAVRAHRRFTAWSSQDALSSPRPSLVVLTMRTVMVVLLAFDETAGLVVIWITVVSSLLVLTYYPPGASALPRPCAERPITRVGPAGWSLSHQTANAFACASHILSAFGRAGARAGRSECWLTAARSGHVCAGCPPPPD
jgi:hypothetical protein